MISIALSLIEYDVSQINHTNLGPVGLHFFHN